MDNNFRPVRATRHTSDPMHMYVECRGHQPSLTPLLKDRGLI